jgi:hypothetical protein
MQTALTTHLYYQIDDKKWKITLTALGTKLKYGYKCCKIGHKLHITCEIIFYLFILLLFKLEVFLFIWRHEALI